MDFCWALTECLKPTLSTSEGAGENFKKRQTRWEYFSAGGKKSPICKAHSLVVDHAFSELCSMVEWKVTGKSVSFWISNTEIWIHGPRLWEKDKLRIKTSYYI